MKPFTCLQAAAGTAGTTRGRRGTVVPRGGVAARGRTTRLSRLRVAPRADTSETETEYRELMIIAGLTASAVGRERIQDGGGDRTKLFGSELGCYQGFLLRKIPKKL